MSPYTGSGESHVTKMEVGVMSGAVTLMGAAGAVGWIREESAHNTSGTTSYQLSKMSDQYTMIQKP